MKPCALVVDDDPDIIQEVKDILETLSHECEAADSVTAARQCIARKEYTYFVIDLQIPVHSGHGLSRIQNGENLIDEIILQDEGRKERIIAITAHGNDGPYQSVEIMKKRIADYITKPFPTSGKTLDKAILAMLAQVEGNVRDTRGSSNTKERASSNNKTHRPIADIDSSASTTECLGRERLLPKQELPTSLESAVDHLLYMLERHRLLFLFFAGAYRINPRSMQKEPGIGESVSEDSIAGWDTMVKDIDTEGTFLFRHRVVLERYAQAAINKFGSGTGRKPVIPGPDGSAVEVEGGSVPYWSIDAESANYLEESSDAIMEACAHLRVMDADSHFRSVTTTVIDVARDNNQPRWYASNWIRWEYLSQLDEVLLALKRAKVEACKPTKEPDTSPKGAPVASVSNEVPKAPKPDVAERPANLTPFAGGEMVFYPDRVELCGVTICGGPRSKRRRDALNLLRVKLGQGFTYYSGEELSQGVGLSSGQNGAAGLIRDIRGKITEALRSQANIECHEDDVILSGGTGYRFSEKISVQDGCDTPSNNDQGHGLGNCCINVPNHVRDVPNPRVPDVRNDDVPNVRDDAAGTRRAWILHQLAEERRLKAPDVAEQFKCSVKTAQRDLQALKDKIKFVGVPRTGYYCMRKPRKSSQ